MIIQTEPGENAQNWQIKISSIIPTAKIPKDLSSGRTFTVEPDFGKNWQKIVIE